MTDASNTTKDDHWVIVAPGVLALPTTGYVIRYKPDRSSVLPYFVYHAGRLHLGYEHLDAAKRGAHNHMSDLIAIGLEP